MGYTLDAVIGSTDQLTYVSAAIGAARAIPLTQGLSLLPITNQVRDEVDDATASQIRGFKAMPAGFDRTLAAWSTQGPVIYVEAEYFGGIGEQTAAVWDQGYLTFGPTHEGENESLPAGSPISQALRLLRVERGTFFDEFDAVGLNRHRHTYEWITAHNES